MELINTFDVSVPVDEAWVVLTDVERIAPCLPGAQLQEIEGDEYRGIVKVKVGPITAQFKGAAHFVERDEADRRAVLRAEGRDTGGKGNAAATITAQLEPQGAGTHVTVTTDLHITGKVAQFGRGALADVSSKLLKQFVEQLETTVLAGGSAATAAAPPVSPAAAARAPEPAAEPAAPAPSGGSTPTAAVPSVSPAAAARAAEPAAEAAATVAPAAPSTGEPSTTTTSSPVEQATPASTVRTINAPEAVPVDLVGTAGMPMLKRLAPVLAGLGGLLVLRRLRRRRRNRAR